MSSLKISALYCCVALFVFFILPMAYFFYEEGGDDHSIASVSSNCADAANQCDQRNNKKYAQEKNKTNLKLDQQRLSFAIMYGLMQPLILAVTAMLHCDQVLSRLHAGRCSSLPHRVSHALL